jgi:hypothetical protein
VDDARIRRGSFRDVFAFVEERVAGGRGGPGGVESLWRGKLTVESRNLSSFIRPPLRRAGRLAVLLQALSP